MEIAIVLVACFFGALLSSMSGGGSGIIMFPVFFAVGMSFPLAAATSAVTSAFWVLPAAYNYLTGTKVDWKFVGLYSAIGLSGTYVSIFAIIAIDQRTIEALVGLFILLLVLFAYWNSDFGIHIKEVRSHRRRKLAYLFAPIQGFYENFFGSGNALAFSVVAYYMRGMTLAESLGHGYLIAFPWTVAGAVLLIQRGYYDVPLMTAAVVGAVGGAFIGSKYARYKGNTFIKTLFVAIGGILGLKLLLGL